MGQPQRKIEHYSYADYKTWSGEVRYELIDGDAYLMAPAPTIDHQTLVVQIARQLGNQLENKPCTVLVAPVDVLLAAADAKEDEIDTVLQPDVLIICDQQKLRPHGIQGAPDWILEVLSPATAVRDFTSKLKAYERAGVREYWLAHPQDRVLHMYLLNGQRYGQSSITSLEGTTSLHILPQVVIDWDSIVPQLLSCNDKAR